jgi:hypothetical protein
MNQPFKRNYLQHALAVGHWMRQNSATGGIDPLNHILEIRCNGRERRFQPQFVLEQATGQLGFTPHLAPNVSGFVSWLPYFNKTWPIAQDKLAFKEHAAREDIRVPNWTTDPAQVRGTFIVKSRVSTLGRGLRGPFEAASAVTLADGEYCEQFIVGQLMKAWFWNDELAVAELVDMPTVRGDGLRTLRQLISAKLAPTEPWPADLEPIAAIQGLSLDGVVPANRKALADYRYMSVLNPATRIDHNVRQKLKGSALESQLLQAGARCWAAVPEDRRQGTVFSLDGVVDPEGQIWFLEVNCNPLLHPAFYESMLNGIFLN